MNFRGGARHVYRRIYRSSTPNRNVVFRTVENGTLFEVVRIKDELQIKEGSGPGFHSTSKLWISTPPYWSLLPSLYANPSILLVGLGGGTVCRIIDKLYKTYHIDAVDISQAIVTIAKRYFDISESDRLALYVEDAYSFIQKAPRSYDIVILDAYSGRKIPEQLMTRDFLGKIVGQLNEGRILSFNLVLATMGPRMSEILSILSSFHFSIFFVVIKGGHNMILYCFKGRISREEFLSKLRAGAESVEKDKDEVTKVLSYLEGALVESNAS
jgi:spermidine synthase